MDAQNFKEDRLKLLKRSALKLRQKKREGIDPSREYESGEVVFSKAQEKFGRIVDINADMLFIDLGEEVLQIPRVQMENEPAAAQEKEEAKPRTSSRKPATRKAPRPVEPEDDDDKGDGRFRWTEEKDDFIRININRSNQWLADQLGTTVASVKGRTHRLKESGFISSDNRRNFVWDDERDAYLLAHIEESNKILADKLDTTVGSVKGRIRRLRDRGVIPRGERKNG